MSNMYDIVIIGAGIMGCSTALELARRGQRVAVIERHLVGSGSTGYSSAIIRTHYSNEVTARMALHSLRVFQDFKKRVGGECGFVQTGFLLLAPPGDAAGMLANVEMQRALGIECEILSRAEIELRWSYLDMSGINQAVYEPQSGFADPNLTLSAYVEAARALGVAFFQESPVQDLVFDGGEIAGVVTSSGMFQAKRVLNASGAWSATLAGMAGVDLPVRACRVQVAFFRRPAGHQNAHPVVADFANAVYWREETGAQTLVGLIDPGEAQNVVDPDHFNRQVDFEFIAEAGERLVRRFPALEAGESTGGYAALYGITPDWHPVIDEAPAGSGLFHCAGFSGHGFKLGPAVGLMAADMLQGLDTEGMPRRLFRLSRFEEGDPVRGRYEYSIVG